MQSTGHTSRHCGRSKWPTHSVQRAGSITQISGPGEIALFGHSGSQTSQLMHSSVIIKAMAQSLCAGAHGATAPVRRFLPKLIDLVLQGKIDPGRFST